MSDVKKADRHTHTRGLDIAEEWSRASDALPEKVAMRASPSETGRILGRMPPPLPQSMARDWQLGHSQTFVEYSQEEQDALFWAQQNTMCALFCCSAPKCWVAWRYLPYQFVKVFLYFMMDSDIQYRLLCKERCIEYELEPETDAYEVVVSNDWVSNLMATAGSRFGLNHLGKPDLTIPGPEAKRLIGYMLNDKEDELDRKAQAAAEVNGGSSAERFYYEPTHEHAEELQNLWLVLRDVVSETPEKAKELKVERLQTVLKKMLRSDASWGRMGANTVISSYYRTDAFKADKISIDGADFKDAGVAISGLVAEIMKGGGDVLFDPNEDSYLQDVIDYLTHKKEVFSETWSGFLENMQRAGDVAVRLAAKAGFRERRRSKSEERRRKKKEARDLQQLRKDKGRYGDPERALKFVEKRVGENGKRIWAMLYSLAIAKAAQSQSPVVVIRKCIKGPDGKYLPKYGPGQDFEMDFLERRRNLDEVYASAGCKLCYPLMSVFRLSAFDATPAHYLEMLGKSHVVIIEHEDTQQGFADLVAALKGKKVTITIEASNGVKTIVGNPGAATGEELAQLVDGVKVHGGKWKPRPWDEFGGCCCCYPVHWFHGYNVAFDNQHERNGLFSMVTKADEWLNQNAHIRVRKATIGQPDYIWTPDSTGVKALDLPIWDTNFYCAEVNFKMFGCFEFSGQVKNAHISDPSDSHSLSA